MNNDQRTPMLFDDRQLSVSDSQFLTQKELRIRSILMQSAIEVGKELIEVRKWFALNRKWGFEAWVREKFGYTPEYAHRFMTIAEKMPEANNCLLPDASLDTQFQLAKAPDPQAAVDEAAIRRQIEGEITAKKAREIAEYQRAGKIASDNAKSEYERAEALKNQLTYVNRQLDQAQAAQKPQIKEVLVEKEVIPQKVKERQRELEDRVSALSTQKAEIERQAEQIRKQRDLYKHDLEKERKADNAVFLQNLQPKADERVRANCAEVMREIVAWSVASRMKLGSVVDTQVYGAEEWQRIEEAFQACTILATELRKLKNPAVSSYPSQQSLVVESTMTEERW